MHRVRCWRGDLPLPLHRPWRPGGAVRRVRDRGRLAVRDRGGRRRVRGPAWTAARPARGSPTPGAAGTSRPCSGCARARGRSSRWTCCTGRTWTRRCAEHGDRPGRLRGRGTGRAVARLALPAAVAGQRGRDRGDQAGLHRRAAVEREHVAAARHGEGGRAGAGTSSSAPTCRARTSRTRRRTSGRPRCSGSSPARSCWPRRTTADLAAAREAGLATAFIARPLEHGPDTVGPTAPRGDWDLAGTSITEIADRLG